MPRTVTFFKMIRLFGDSLMLGTFILFLWLFVSAYLSRDFTATIHINKYGEAQVEMILLIFIMLPLFLITAILSFRDWEYTIYRGSLKPVQIKRRTLGYDSIHIKYGEHVVCPDCFGRFYVSQRSFTNVTCPYCQAMGIYEPENPMLS